MTQQEFIEKWITSDSEEIKQDFQSVIQDELVKFKDFLNSEYELPKPI